MQFINRQATASVGMGISGPNVGQKLTPGTIHGSTPPFGVHPAVTGQMPPMVTQSPGQNQPPRPAVIAPPPPYNPQPMPNGQAPPSQYYPPGQQTHVPPPSLHSMPPGHGINVGPSLPSRIASGPGSIPPVPGSQVNTSPQQTSYGTIQTQQLNRLSAPPVPAIQRQAVNTPHPPVNIRAGNQTVEQISQNMPTLQFIAPALTDVGSNEPVSVPARNMAPPTLPGHGQNMPTSVGSVPPFNPGMNATPPIMSNPVKDSKQPPSTMLPPPPPPPAFTTRIPDAAAAAAKPHERPLPPPPPFMTPGRN